MKAIFVVDMVNGFCKEGALYSNNIESIIVPIKNFLETQYKDNDIYFLNDAHSNDDIEMQSYPIHCLKNSKESQVVDELKKYAKNIIEKNSTNSFFALKKEILSKYDSFEIIGCCSDICILQFAITLKTYFNHLKQNKEIIVFKNLIATFNIPNHNSQEYHDFALNLMANAGIKIK
ncbi:isochorismatase family cysteine hydrolase [Metamycoplasma hominis]|uniref:isochorismatase family cysteine hydrolase n=1 Tax=Metamycoplasma hominis TaxID=2098 RepID=UPI00066C69CE|nr:isochorismatase family cysteine hydrolase [Metamycoplasma hominis]